MTENKTSRRTRKPKPVAAAPKEQPEVNERVLDVQRWLARTYKFETPTSGVADKRTIEDLVKALQTEIAIEVTGTFDEETKKNAPSITFESLPKFVRILQAILIIRGRAIPFDGIFDHALRGAVENWQTTHKLPTDGIAGPETLCTLFN